MTPGELARQLSIARQRLGAVQAEALDRVGALVAKEAQTLIGTEYPGWPALAESTVAEKERLGFIGRISDTDPLLRTGEMRDSVSHYVDGNRVVIGSPDPVATFHEYGTSKMPPRPFLAAALVRKTPDAAKLIAAAVLVTIAGRDVSE